MVSRILAPFYHLQQDAGFPPPNFDVQHPDGTGSLNLNVSVRSDAHTALAREIAGASTVLLKNINANGARAGNAAGLGGKALPLQTSFTGSVAIVGQDAKMPQDGCNLNECDEGVMVIGCVSFYFIIVY
jgi:beta-glucosidase